MTRNTALTLTLGAAALVLVGTKTFNAQHSDRHVVQVASSATVDTDDDTTRSGYIIASS